ncbi:hypothetical protein FS749_016646 [Ceratobasidium sp. UAMH 11750]|nr:hypothetical protein FS749_016646 [Ceratobasidium sp. UAMH 11750]
MSSFKLILRPPPHVEFLQGYPGVVPHGDRKGASVRGTLELRGIAKAKWVRVELRKIEVLPGGGQNDTFSETIGERPTTLWSSQQDEFIELHSQNDFPFDIDVPEAVPPSIALERGAAIRYELVASAMLKGKKLLFKRDPTLIPTSITPIVIEKYDLLQTWPIYATPQSRTSNAYGVTLVANLNQSGFGPGDVVSVEAILRADASGAGVMLRGYELTVRETLIFRRPGPPLDHSPDLDSQPSQKRTPAIQTRSNIISDQKVLASLQLFPGHQHRCDLGCQIPFIQTNVSVRTARHIEVNYVVQVKAVLSNNTVVVVDLPVTITNWPRQASQDVVARIGYAPELVGGRQSPSMSNIISHLSSNPPPFSTVSPGPSPNAPDRNGVMGGWPSVGSVPSNGASSSTAGSVPERVSHRTTATIESPGRNTLPSYNTAARVGYIPAHPQVQAQTMPSGHTSNRGHTASNSLSGPGGYGGGDPEGHAGAVASLDQGPTGAVPLPRSSSNRHLDAPQQQFTVVNIDEPERKHLDAEEEKRLLRGKYAKQDEQRRKQQLREGGSSARPENTRPSAANSTATSNRGWPSTEEETKRLYAQARQAAARAQWSVGYGTYGHSEGPPAPVLSGGASSAVGGSSAGAGGSSRPDGMSSLPTTKEEIKFADARKMAAQTQQAAFDTPAPYAYDPGVGGGGGANGWVGSWAFGSGRPMAAGAGSGEGSNTSYAPPAPAEPALYAQQQEPQQAKPTPQQRFSAADGERTLSERSIIISRKMLASEIIPHLVGSGCADVTARLDMDQCGAYPIAGGGFGDIYQGALVCGMRVAIKSPRLFLKNDEQGNKILKNVAREIYAWSKLKHPNVLELVGLSTFRGQISIVSAWMENGTLPEYIVANPGIDRYQLCVQISAGLTHLHESETVHGDLKGSNVLVSDNGIAKLTDFGNAVLKKHTLEFTGTTSGSKISVRWTAPEVLRGESAYTKEADVYALGMTFYVSQRGDMLLFTLETYAA